MISIDALVLEASRQLAEPANEAHMNSALAGAAHKIGFTLTEEMAEEGLENLKRAYKRAGRV